MVNECLFVAPGLQNTLRRDQRTDHHIGDDQITRTEYFTRHPP